MSKAVVVEQVLLDGGGVVVVRARSGACEGLRLMARRSVLQRIPAVGETWQVAGMWRRHPKHGWRVEIQQATLVRPSGRLLVDALARSSAFPGIGPIRAQAVWDAYGEDAFDLLDAGRVDAFEPVLGDELARVLVSGWQDLDADIKAYRWLTTNGFPVDLGRKLIAIYSALPVPEDARADAARVGQVLWHLSQDPYRMLAFSNWPTVDAAARHLGVKDDDICRLVGSVEAVLAARLREGHTWQPLRAVVAAAGCLLRAPYLADQAVHHAIERGAVVQLADGLQLPGCAVMERIVEQNCMEMADGSSEPIQPRLGVPYARSLVDAKLDEFQEREGYALTTEQRDAVWMALTRSICLLLGGPGVGKTSVLKAVHHAVEEMNGRVIQAALAGRAALRMAEATARPALTIAALLRRLETRDETFDDAPLVVIDEASMVDLPLMYRLLRYFKPGARLLLVGDPGQLPPINFGLVFHVLAEDRRIPRTVLTHVMRQSVASGIPAACSAIREGQAPTFATSQTAGVSFIEAAASEVSDTVIDVIERLGGVSHTQVVSAVKRGPGGVRDINDRLHALVTVGRRACKAGFYEGEPVTLTKTNYDLDIRNGELGKVLEDTTNGLRIRFDMGEVELPATELGNLELAYALTCHRAQGSQFPQVVVPVTRNRLLDRALLLTAVSRAQERVVLIGDRRAFESAVQAPPGPSLRLVGLGRRASTTAEAAL